jgi:hypothetical protein
VINGWSTIIVQKKSNANIYMKIFIFKKYLIFRTVSVEEGELKAKELDVMFIETSARVGFNIKGLFRKVASSLPDVDTIHPLAKSDCS